MQQSHRPAEPVWAAAGPPLGRAGSLISRPWKPFRPVAGRILTMCGARALRPIAGPCPTQPPCRCFSLFARLYLGRVHRPLPDDLATGRTNFACNVVRNPSRLEGWKAGLDVDAAGLLVLQTALSDFIIFPHLYSLWFPERAPRGAIWNAYTHFLARAFVLFSKIPFLGVVAFCSACLLCKC